NMGLILFGGGAILYFLTAVTAIVIEGDLLHNFWQQRMRRRLDGLRRHVVVVGLGGTGRRALDELLGADIEVVAIDRDPQRVERALERYGERLPFVIGDALDEATLVSAGIGRAAGMIAALHDDRENLYLAVTARQMNAEMRLVSRVSREQNIEKFEGVGVDSVVHTARIGGQRLSNELLRPEIIAFTDAMLATESRGLSLGRVEIGPGTRFGGQRLADASLGDRTGCLIMGLRDGSDGEYEYHPPADRVLSVGGFLIALGTKRQLRTLTRLLS
ncbi:MAG: voltage-gated potassium channel, partial [Myxococcota bacterium]